LLELSKLKREKDALLKIVGQMVINLSTQAASQGFKTES